MSKGHLLRSLQTGSTQGAEGHCCDFRISIGCPQSLSQNTRPAISVSPPVAGGEPDLPSAFKDSACLSRDEESGEDWLEAGSGTERNRQVWPSGSTKTDQLRPQGGAEQTEERTFAQAPLPSIAPPPRLTYGRPLNPAA